MKTKALQQLALLAVLVASHAAAAGSYDLDWWTVDGGGATFSTGGDFELGGTAGQPDAGRHDGGGYAVGGGFWQMIELLLSVEATPAISAAIAGDPLAAGGFTGYSVELDDGTPVTLTAPGTVLFGGATYAFLRWDLGGAPQPDHQTAVAFPLLAATTATAVYLSPPGPVDVDMDITAGGLLNPDGPACRSLGIDSVPLNGNPADTPIAIRLGDGPTAKWLQIVGGDLSATGDAEEWRTAAEWAARLRGLTPATAYTLYAKAGAGLNETSLSQAGPFDTSQDCDVNRSGFVNALDWACIKAAILRGGLSWPCDVDNSRLLDSDDLDDTMTPILNP
ncbi:hypothetical protein ACFL09_02035 [Planctomycetota bacterium]